MLIKICGVTTVEDALHAARAGADLIGINLWVRSPRSVDIQRAAEIIAALRRESNPPKVALVVVMPDVADIAEHAAVLKPDYVQVHGAWGVQTEIAGVPVLRAFSLGGEEDLAAIAAWPGDSVLVDARVEGMHGGTGKTVPPELVARVQRPFILAGGLSPLNVADAVRRFQPQGVDVASGVESSPGVKDPVAVEKFIQGARTA